MFKYNQDRDRFIPDRLRNSYFFNTVQHNPLNHLCIGVSNCRESDFIEPFECERQQEQQTRALRQMQSYMSLEFNGGHILLGPSINAHHDKKHARYIDSYLNEDGDLKWPIRMADRRLLARKSVNKTLCADLLLDMPNLSNNWMTKILDWSSTGYLTAAIESSIHLWSDRTQSVHYTIRATDLNESESSIKTTISSLKWDVRGEKLGYSFTVDRIYVSCPLSDETITDSHTNTSEGSNGSTLHGTPTASRVSTHTIFDGDRVQDNTLEGAHANTPEQPSFNTSEVTTVSLNGVVKTHYIKVWRLNGEQDGSNNEQKSSTCGCLNNNNNYHRNECTVVVMDWLANGSILVTGCTRGTVTFFKYDFQQKQLITTHTMYFGKLKKTSIPTLISCLHVSLDKWNRHLAVASYSRRICVLRVFKIIDPPELCHKSRSRYDGVDFSANISESLTDRYRSNGNITKCVIKAFAWHPWKYSLMCYAVMSVNQDVPSFGSTAPPSWFVLANACKGQVLKRVEQTMCRYTCPTVQILAVSTHSMTFSHITGELLVSTTTAYRVQKSSTSSPSIIEKHSVMVMHALNRIVETLNCTQTEKGLLFAWSPDGLRIALTSSDECLRIWNFWPTVAVKKKPDHLLRNSTTNGTSSDTLDILIDERGLSNSTIRSNVNNHLNNQSLMSELSLDASRIIK